MVAQRSKAVLACLPAFLFALYPLSAIASVNAGAFGVDPVVVGRSMAVVVAGVALFLLGLRPVIPDFTTRAIWLSWFLLPLSCYGFAVAAMGGAGVVIAPQSTWFAVTYTLASLALSTMAVRPWETRTRDVVTLNLVAAVLLGVNILVAGSKEVATLTERWRGAADELIGANLATKSTPPPAPARDVYYIVLDGFGRADTLEELYGIDPEPFGRFLESKGFYVPSAARSNYSQTFLSFASMLNMNYLDTVASALGTNSTLRTPLEYLIQHNALMRLAKRAGYRVIGVGSDYMATYRFDSADTCWCERFGPDPLELAAIRLTPLAALRVGRLAVAAHRKKILDSFDAIDRATSVPESTFVFAHIIAPHPPFVFGPDGSARSENTLPFSFSDGDHFPGSREAYVRGYRGQTEFVMQRLRRLVEHLLNTPGPAPVIIVHGDHGPGSMLHWEDPDATNKTERMSIFAAYYFPESSEGFYPTITPLNGARLLANRYFGADLSLQKDESFLSTWTRPFDFIR